MREIELSPEFVKQIQELAPKESESILKTVLEFAKALEVVSCSTAEDMLYDALVTYSVAGRQMDQEMLTAALDELWRIRAEKGDGFNTSPVEGWSHLKRVRAYKTIGKELGAMELGMIMHTISDFLKNNPNHIAEAVEEMKMFEEDVTQMAEIGDKENIDRFFNSVLIGICGAFVGREDYLLSCACCYSGAKFEIAFARLFIKMAKDFCKTDKTTK